MRWMMAWVQTGHTKACVYITVGNIVGSGEPRLHTVGSMGAAGRAKACFARGARR